MTERELTIAEMHEVHKLIDSARGAKIEPEYAPAQFALHAVVRDGIAMVPWSELQQLINSNQAGTEQIREQDRAICRLQAAQNDLIRQRDEAEALGIVQGMKREDAEELAELREQSEKHWKRRALIAVGVALCFSWVVIGVAIWALVPYLKGWLGS